MERDIDTAIRAVFTPEYVRQILERPIPSFTEDSQVDFDSATNGNYHGGPLGHMAYHFGCRAPDQFPLYADAFERWMGRDVVRDFTILHRLQVLEARAIAGTLSAPDWDVVHEHLIAAWSRYTAMLKDEAA